MKAKSGKTRLERFCFQMFEFMGFLRFRVQGLGFRVSGSFWNGVKSRHKTGGCRLCSIGPEV